MICVYTNDFPQPSAREISNVFFRWKNEDAVIYHGLLSAIKQTNHLTICDACSGERSRDMRLHNNHIFCHAMLYIMPHHNVNKSEKRENENMSRGKEEKCSA
jgi:hypothetical protein